MGGGVQADAVSAPDFQNPSIVVGTEEDGGVTARDHLAGTEVDVHELIIVVWIGTLVVVGSAAKVDGSPLDVESPAVSHDLCKGVDTVLCGESRVGIFSRGVDGLVRRGKQVFGNRFDDDIERLSGGQKIVG